MPLRCSSWEGERKGRITRAAYVCSEGRRKAEEVTVAFVVLLLEGDHANDWYLEKRDGLHNVSES